MNRSPLHPRLMQYYSTLSDDALIRAYAAGRGGYQSDEVWQLIVTEVLGRESTRKFVEGQQRALERLARPLDELKCHLCGRSGPVSTFRFGLAGKVSRDWSGTVLTAMAGIGVSALVGSGGVMFLSPAKRAPILKLQLQLCPACVEAKRTRFLRKVQLTEQDYAVHPKWKDAVTVGFTEFLDADELDDWLGDELDDGLEGSTQP